MLCSETLKWKGAQTFAHAIITVIFFYFQYHLTKSNSAEIFEEIFSLLQAYVLYIYVCM